MKDSIILLTFFVLGIIAAYTDILPDIFIENDFSTYALYCLMFFVGIGIGMDHKARSAIFTIRPKIILIPVGTIIGTLAGVSIISVVLQNIALKNALAVGSGFGYYSLSSIFISELSGEKMGVIALISNIIREVSTLVIAPFLAKYFGKVAPVACGGATSMDSTLPAIIKADGKDWAVIGIFNGIVLTILVPFLVTFILQ